MAFADVAVAADPYLRTRRRRASPACRQPVVESFATAPYMAMRAIFASRRAMNGDGIPHRSVAPGRIVAAVFTFCSPARFSQSNEPPEASQPLVQRRPAPSSAAGTCPNANGFPRHLRGSEVACEWAANDWSRSRRYAHGSICRWRTG